MKVWSYSYAYLKFLSIHTHNSSVCLICDVCMQPDLENKCTHFNEQICIRSQNSPVDLSSQILQRLQITKYSRASVNKNVQSSLPSLMLKRETKKLVSFYYQCLTDNLSVLLSDHVYISLLGYGIQVYRPNNRLFSHYVGIPYNILLRNLGTRVNSLWFG